MSACCCRPHVAWLPFKTQFDDFLLQFYFFFFFNFRLFTATVLQFFRPASHHSSSPSAPSFSQAPCSSPELLKLCHPVDPNGYSPQDSFSSSSSSSCYDSPTRMESGHSGFAAEHFHYQHCTPQDCYCPPSCWPAQQESYPPVPEYAPYYTQTDFSYGCPVEENYFKRDYQMSSEMCYNVL